MRGKWFLPEGDGDVRSVRRTAGRLGVLGALVAAVLGTGQTAGAVTGDGGGWTEQGTGAMSVMTLAQPSASVTWAAGATVDDGADGLSFTPVMLARDTAAGPGWSPVALPGAADWDSRINDLSVNGDGSAFFVGDQSGQDGRGVLVGREGGGAWQLSGDAALPAGTQEASLLSVSSRSASNAWAVGQGYTASGAPIPLAQHFDGKRWKNVTVPGSADWSFNQVDEVSAHDIWIVGVDEDTGQSLALHGDGTHWTRTPTPAHPDSAVLFDVTARTPDDVWAVGWSRDTDKQRPAGEALHWDGTAWSEVPVPAGTFSLQSVALRPHGGIAVVGGNDDAPVGLAYTPAAGWTSLDLPSGDSQLALGVATVAASGRHLTVGGWRFVSSGGGDSFSSGLILSR